LTPSGNPPREGITTVRTSSNPVFRNLPKDKSGYASFGSGAAAQYGQTSTQYQQPQPYSTTRSMTIDDVVTKTAMTLGLLAVAGVISATLCANNPGLIGPLAMGGAIVGLVLVLVATFGRKMSAPIVLSYAVAEGVFIGAISFVFGHIYGNAIIGQAVVGTVGVFAGMLVVYKTGAIRVTPKFTRMLIGGLIGVLALMIMNLVGNLVFHADMGLRSGGPLAIGFSLLCIGLAAFCFLLDFDQADKLIRAGAPEQAAWGVALGLTVTLVWLYVEILRLLSYFRS
jgi:uncharacterized YccA/Bax inhibitor family protein